MDVSTKIMNIQLSVYLFEHILCKKFIIRYRWRIPSTIIITNFLDSFYNQMSTSFTCFYFSLLTRGHILNRLFVPSLSLFQNYFLFLYLYIILTERAFAAADFLIYIIKPIKQTYLLNMTKNCKEPLSLAVRRLTSI